MIVQIVNHSHQWRKYRKNSNDYISRQKSGRFLVCGRQGNAQEGENFKYLKFTLSLVGSQYNKARRPRSLYRGPLPLQLCLCNFSKKTNKPMDFIKDWIGNEIEYTILPLTKTWSIKTKVLCTILNASSEALGYSD